MATCPKCGKQLTDQHTCRLSWKRRWLAVIVTAIGAAAGLLASIVLFPQSANRLLSMPTLTVLGGVVALSMWWSRPRRVE
jgi:hypothetical protein